MSTPIIQKEVADLMLRFKDKSKAEQVDLSLKVIDDRIKDQPLVVLFHEMKKELYKIKSTL